MLMMTTMSCYPYQVQTQTNNTWFFSICQYLSNCWRLIFLFELSGLTIIDDTQDDFVFNPYDEILNMDDDDDFIPKNILLFCLTYACFDFYHVPKSYNLPNQNQPTTLLWSLYNNRHNQQTTNQNHLRIYSKQISQSRSVSQFIKWKKNKKSWKKNWTEMRYHNAFWGGLFLTFKQNKICQFFVQGICRYGSACRYIHGNVCETCQKPVLLLDNPQQNEGIADFRDEPVANTLSRPLGIMRLACAYDGGTWGL